MFPSYLYFSKRRTLPVVLQAEAAECGLACLAMISQYHGHKVDLNGLRQRFNISLSGTTLRHLIEFSSELHLSARPIRVDLEELDGIKVPAILHWGANHFVVLDKINRKSATIHDPSKGKVKVPLSQLSKNFTGIALEIIPKGSFEAIELRAPVRFSMLWQKIHGLPSAIIQIIALSLTFQIVTFVLPLQMQFIVDEALANSDRELLLIIVLTFFSLYILHATIEAVRNWLLQLLGQQFIFQVVGNLVNHLLTLPSSYFEKRHLGDVLSRMQSTRVIQDTFTRGLISSLIDGLMALVAAACLFLYSIPLGLIAVSAFALLTIINFLIFPLIRSRTEEQLAASAKEQSILMEMIRATTTIKLLGREAEREASWRNDFIDATNLSLQVSRFNTVLTFVRTTITAAQYTSIIYYGALMIISSAGFSVGMLIAFLSFRQTFSDRATNFLEQINQMRLLRVHLDRLGDIILQKPDSTISNAAGTTVEGGIQLRRVSFQYGISDQPVLNNINLSVDPGEFIAIVGPSGGGKSTLMKILLGLYAPSEGEVLLDGAIASHDVWRSWRGQAGVVVQDDKLLSGTIADNIAFFDPELNMDNVINAAKSAQIHEEILRKPMQYRTLIGDMGSTLSGGQKQRVLLARALYRNPRILLLDEGTANLDANNEGLIATHLANLNITKIVVAHRSALIEHADRIFQLANGQLTELVSQRKKDGKSSGPVTEKHTDRVALSP